jgi:II/X family phage/plasmid replication protein
LYSIKLPFFSEWLVKRLDTCYVFKTKNQEERVQLLEILSYCKYKNFKTYNYKTAVLWVGTDYSVKFYLKHEEYLKKDFNQLVKQRMLEYAEYLVNYSKNLVRFEITHRSSKLFDMFGKQPTVEDIMQYNILQNIYLYTKEIVKPGVEIMTNINVFKRLKSKYSSTRAIQLYQFYKTYNGFSCDRQFLMESYDRKTIYNNLKDIRNAGIKIDTPENDKVPQLQKVYEDFLLQVEELGKKAENFTPL